MFCSVLRPGDFERIAERIALRHIGIKVLQTQLHSFPEYTAFLCLLPDLSPQFRKFLYDIFKRKALVAIIEAQCDLDWTNQSRRFG